MTYIIGIGLQELLPGVPIIHAIKPGRGKSQLALTVLLAWQSQPLQQTTCPTSLPPSAVSYMNMKGYIYMYVRDTKNRKVCARPINSS